MNGRVYNALVLFGGLALVAASAAARPFDSSPTAVLRSERSPSADPLRTAQRSDPITPVYAPSDETDTGNAGEEVRSGYSMDTAQSSALTSFLKANRLPLVRAQVFTSTSGNRQVVLYGFVATELGKQNAVIRSRRYLRAPNLQVINRIAVRPELAATSAAPSPAPADIESYVAGGFGTAQNYQNQTEEAQRQEQMMQDQQKLEATLLLLRLLMGFL